jgi:hypothetical protein
MPIVSTEPCLLAHWLFVTWVLSTVENELACHLFVLKMIYNTYRHRTVRPLSKGLLAYAKKHKNSGCKAPGATLAPPNLRPTYAIERIWFLNRPTRNRPARTLIIFFFVPRQRQSAHVTYSKNIFLPTAKGGSQYENRMSVLLRAYTLLTTMFPPFLLPRRALSCDC